MFFHGEMIIWYFSLFIFSLKKGNFLMLNYPFLLGIQPCMPLVCCSLKCSWTQFADILFSIFAWAQAPDPFLVCPYPAVEPVPTGLGGRVQSECLHELNQVTSTQQLPSSTQYCFSSSWLCQPTLHPGQHPCLLIPLILYTPSPSTVDSVS